MLRDVVAILAFVFWPSRFTDMSLEEADKQDQEAKTQPKDRRTDFEGRTSKLRQAWGWGILLTLVAILMGWVLGRILQPIESAHTWSVILQMIAAGTILSATLSVLGWEIQTYNGKTLPEHLNRLLFRIAYVLGTAALVASLGL